ncbi:MAG: hypothetical protein JWP72_1604, partial [Massilia sp.]|nr:hypothetical protein [Massilia sp.]
MKVPPAQLSQGRRTRQRATLALLGACALLALLG